VSGSNNIALGSGSLFCNQSGNNNVAVGIQASHFHGGENNVTMGWCALYGRQGANNTGRNNVAVGARALGNNTYGSDNVAIGGDAMINSYGGCSSSFNQISNPGGSDGLAQGGCAGGCSNGAGTIQQMFSFDQFISQGGIGQNGLPNPCTTSSTNCGTGVSHTLVVGLTNNAIYSYSSSTSQWTQLQAPDPSSYPLPLTGTTPSGGAFTGDGSLQDALNWGRSLSTALGTDGSPVWSTSLGLCLSSSTCAPQTAVKDPLSQTTTDLPYGDPIFGLMGATAGNTPSTPSALQAYCGNKCSSYGDYTPIFDYTPDIGNKKLSAGGTQNGYGTEVELIINSLTYGYLFSPNGIIDKFIPGKYSVGVVTAVQVGPEVTVTYPKPLTGVPPTLGPIKKNVPLSHTWETEVGSFSLSTGADISVSASFVGLVADDGDCSSTSTSTSCTVDLASAGFTTGLLYTWNPYTSEGNGGRMNMSFADFYGYDVADFNYAVVTPTVSPYLQAEYGLFTPPSTPLIGKWSVFDLGVSYKNPITAPITIDNGDVSMTVKSKGDIDTFAQFIPNVTKALSWKHQWQVYSDKWGPFDFGNGTGS
jgi:hypothetical protein